MTKRKLQYWVIPPEADAEFVAAMEAVLDTYEKAYDPDHPVLSMDEQPVQLVRETRRPIPATKRHARRVDYEYERAGTASIFMFTEPLAESGGLPQTLSNRRFIGITTYVDRCRETKVIRLELSPTDAASFGMLCGI